VASLARPGGNLTGFSTAGREIIGKRLELLKETFPQVVRVAYLQSPTDATNDLARQNAAKLGLQLMSADALKDGNFPRAIAALAQADAWFIAEHHVNYGNGKTIIESIAKQRKPAMYPSSFFTALGGLMSYSVDQRDQYRRTATLVDRILRGAKPADLPVEEPTVFEFVVNMKTAKALGLTIPQSMRFRIDRVIE
jgi:putative ABC transport system substrate-binding protein